MPKPSKSRRPAADPSTGFSRAELAAAKQAGDQSKSRNPREVLDAFMAPPLTCADLVLQPLSLATFMLFEIIQSPFVEEGGAEVTAADTAAALFILTRPVEEANAILTQGRPAFDRAVLAFAKSIPAGELAAIGLKLKLAIERAFSTVVESEKKTATASSPSAATASAGG